MCGNWLSALTRGFGVAWPRRLFGTSAVEGHGQNMDRSALIVVDMQNDFIFGSLALCNCPSKHNGEEIIHLINKLTSELPWKLVVFTKDWHPHDHISFVDNVKSFIPHAENKVDLKKAAVYDRVIYDIDGQAREQVLWPAHCIQGSSGADLHEKLVVPGGGVIMNKGINRNIDSYSAFFDNDHLSQTDLDSVLKARGISAVYVCGVATDVCVNFTVRDAKDLGYETLLVKDCCRGVDVGNIKAALDDMEKRGISIVTSEQLLQDSK